MATGRPASASVALDERAAPRTAGAAMRILRIALLLALLVPGPVFAQQRARPVWVPSSPTLERIYDRGVVVLGYRENSPPFAFLDAAKRPVGYSLDLCDIVVDQIAAELHKDLRVELRPVTLENRFELVASGAIDLECGSSTNTPERRKVVAFSPTTFVTGAKLLVRRGSGIRWLADLAGKTVVLTHGTVHKAAIPALAQRRKLPIKFVTAADHQESFQMVATGKADAFANDDVQLHGMIAATKSAADFRVVGDFLTYADYALVLPQDDPEFAEVVDRAFRKLAGSRQIVAIYDRWFIRPLPSGERLGLPMSPHLAPT